MARANQRKREEETRKIVQEAKNEAHSLLENPLFSAGLMLYWAEGDKSEKTETVKFSNSDPRMIILIMRWFRQVCAVPEAKFRITVHKHKLLCGENIEQFWAKTTGVPLTQFYKTQVKPTSLRHRKNPLYLGTCAIRVENRSLFRKIKGWKEGFLEIMGIDDFVPVAQMDRARDF